MSSVKTLLINSKHHCIYEENNNKVIKLTFDEKKKLKKEYELLKILKKKNFYSKSLVNVYEDGILKTGLFKKSYFYRQEYIEKKTLSWEIQNLAVSKKQIQDFLKKLLDEFILNHINSEKKHDNKSYFSNININLQKLKKNHAFNFFLKAENIKINEKKIDNNFNIQKIINNLKKIIDKNNISFKYDHFNFHGENIFLMPKTDINFVRIIDPDPSITLTDPMFSLARLAYSLPHDAMQLKKGIVFYNQNNNLVKQVKFKYFFNYEILDLYNVIGFQNIFNNINRNFDKNHAVRFMLSYIYCLIIGINRNSDKKYLFKNKGIFNKETILVFELINALKFTNDKL